MERAERIARMAAKQRAQRGVELPDRSDVQQLRSTAEPKPRPAEPKQAEPAVTKLSPIAAPAGEPVKPFACPRCGQRVEGESFYGPCNGCRAQLRGGATVRGCLLGTHPTSSPGPAGAAAVLRRQQRRHLPKVVAYRTVSRTVAELLHDLPAGVDRVVLLGPRPGLTADRQRSWYMGDLPAGWEHDQAGHYLTGDHPIGKYRAPDGRRVELHRAAAWFGEGDYGAVEVAVAFAELADQLGRSPLLSTPATTGRELLLSMVPERVDGWPCLTAEHQALIRSTSGQGRVELFTRDGGQLDGLHEYDGRFMYAALCRQLGAGPAELIESPRWERFARARWLVDVEVPAGWSGPGLLGLPDPDGSGWLWPATAGDRFQTWADGCEVDLARQHGWTAEPVAALRLVDGKADPLGSWSAKLQRMRDSMRSPLAASAVRRVLLTTLGTLHGRPHRVTKVLPLDQADRVPDDAGTVRQVGGTLVFDVETETAWPAMSHPEWTSAVWARARTRLLSCPGEGGRTGALHMAPGTRLVALRTDAVYVDRQQPAWHEADDGRPGRLSYRGGVDKRMPAPVTSAALLQLAHGWRG